MASELLEQTIRELHLAHHAFDEARAELAHKLRVVQTALNAGARTDDVAYDYMLAQGDAPWRTYEHEGRRKPLRHVHELLHEFVTEVEELLAPGVPILFSFDASLSNQMGLFVAFVSDPHVRLSGRDLTIPVERWWDMTYHDTSWARFMPLDMQPKACVWSPPDVRFFQGAYRLMRDELQDIHPNEDMSLPVAEHRTLSIGSKAIRHTLEYLRDKNPKLFNGLGLDAHINADRENHPFALI